MAIVAMNPASSQLNIMPGIGDGASLKSKSMTYDFTAAVVSGTVLTGPLLQAGSVWVDTIVITNGLGTATLDVGDDLDPNRFIAAGTGAVIRSNVATARPYRMTKNDTIDITTGTASTSAAGSIDITVMFQPLNT